MMRYFHRLQSSLAALLMVWAVLLAPLSIGIANAQAVPKASCPAGIQDRFGECTCPEGMTKLDCEALVGNWENWVPEKMDCSAPPDSTTTGTVIGSDNARAAFLYFIQRGLSPTQSAGIVGNLQAESGVNPTAQEKGQKTGRGGYGIAQWTGSRRTAIESYAASTGADLNSLQFQLDYLYDQELLKGYRTSVYEPLKRTTTVRDASNIWLHKFEAPADQSTAVENKRAAYGEKILELYGAEAGTVAIPTSDTAESACSSTGSSGNATFVGFPLKIDKATIAKLNAGCFPDGAQAMCKGGHPYAAYDIMAPTGTPVLSILDGKVITITTDRCPGRMVSIYSASQDVTVSYLHMSISQTMVKVGDQITAGQQIGIVGVNAEACNAGPHLHIDAATGQPRPGCSRLDCPTANQAIFAAGDQKIGLGAGLYNSYKKLP